jgi:hypothetical protein
MVILSLPVMVRTLYPILIPLTARTGTLSLNPGLLGQFSVNGYQFHLPGNPDHATLNVKHGSDLPARAAMRAVCPERRELVTIM